MSGIDNISGTGKITAKSTAEIHWLIIPSFGAAEKGDTLYYVGAKVNYILNGQENSIEVNPDYVVVKPQPMLTLDYFLPSDVYADDPFTPEIEPAMPFTLGVRIKNTGLGTSYKTVIDSAQPKIVENKQGLLIDFKILGGYVADQPVAKSLLLNFVDIEPLSSTVGRWNMITSLAGKFVELDASLEKEGRKTKLVFPATQGFFYTKLTDPNAGKTELINVKRLPSENIWLSKTRNEDLSWSYFINLFDAKSIGEYSLFEDSMNQIIGTSGNDILYGTPDDDYLQSDTGNDTYLIHKGDGKVTIFDYGNSGEQDKVIFEDLKSTYIQTVTLPNNDILVITFNSGDTVIF